MYITPVKSSFVTNSICIESAPHFSWTFWRPSVDASMLNAFERFCSHTSVGDRKHLFYHFLALFEGRGALRWNNQKRESRGSVKNANRPYEVINISVSEVFQVQACFQRSRRSACANFLISLELFTFPLISDCEWSVIMTRGDREKGGATCNLCVHRRLKNCFFFCHNKNQRVKGLRN